MEKKTYKVKDSLGNIMRIFATYEGAASYKYTYGNSMWRIEE